MFATPFFSLQILVKLVQSSNVFSPSSRSRTGSQVDDASPQRVPWLNREGSGLFGIASDSTLSSGVFRPAEKMFWVCKRVLG